MRALIFVMLIAAVPAVGADDVDFDTWFTGETLRVDLFRTGDAEGDVYSLDEIIVEGPWAGSRTKLIDTLNRGFFLYSVYDNESGKLIYSRGFSSVFGEWLTTDEAKQRKRSIGETARMPRPRKAVDLAVSKRDKHNNFVEF
ncbi:MAG TPA: peptidase M64 N-terminal domain-containing protein, partial [Acidobacteriota bacterium]|nr:peptidase M64 N-terminal domain-containing protein [Acidobacteriota bacterium]